MILCVCYHSWPIFKTWNNVLPWLVGDGTWCFFWLRWPTNDVDFRFWIHMIISLLHVPPWLIAGPLASWSFSCGFQTSSLSWGTIHPMQFGNVIELVSSISSVELEDSDFLLKTYFVKYPLSSLFCLYMYVVWGLGYAIFVLGFGLIFFSS